MKKLGIIIIILSALGMIHAQDATGDTASAVPNSADANRTISRLSMDGWDFYAAGNYQASIRALVEEKKQFPGRINIYIILGWDYKVLKNYAEMEKVSLEGYNINPTHINILRNLGEACYFQNKFEDSAKYFEKYLIYKNQWSDPTTYLIYFYLGYSYFKTGSLYRADAALSAANYARPNNIQNIVLLGNVNEQLAKKDRAIEYYERALVLDPANEEAKSGLARLKKG